MPGLLQGSIKNSAWQARTYFPCDYWVGGVTCVQLTHYRVTPIAHAKGEFDGYRLHVIKCPVHRIKPPSYGKRGPLRAASVMAVSSLFKGVQLTMT
jgi:hypothetical protein